jgi:glutamyl-tRNA reductase
MSLALLGLSHHRTPVEVRERFSFSPQELAPALGRLTQASGAAEGVLLSTCNRIELYLAADEDIDLDAARRTLCSLKPAAPADHARDAYLKMNEAAVEHLFRVASGLDSLLPGETQIIGQIKSAYQTAMAAGRTGATLNRLFQRALRVAKRVHAQTRIDEGGTSVPTAAAKLAEQRFADLPARTVLIVGAGEMGALTARAFRHRKVTRITVLNRTVERARAVAQRVGGVAGPFEALDACLETADIVVTCTRSPQPILKTLHAGRPRLIIDLGIPRNVAPEIGRLDGVTLHRLDDLEQIAVRTRERLKGELARADEIVREEFADYLCGTPYRSTCTSVPKMRTVRSEK